MRILPEELIAAYNKIGLHAVSEDYFSNTSGNKSTCAIMAYYLAQLETLPVEIPNSYSGELISEATDYYKTNMDMKYYSDFMAGFDYPNRKARTITSEGYEDGKSCRDAVLTAGLIQSV